MKKKLFCLVCLLLTFLCVGCGQKEQESQYKVICLNKDKTGIAEVAYEPKNKETDGMIAEFLKALSSDPENVEYKKAIPNDVEVTNYSLEGAYLTIHFDADYSKMSEVEEVLCRAAVVKTLTQIQGVDCVSFFVEDKPLMDKDGVLIGSMTADSFIVNPGQQINAIQNTNLTLYFANAEGDALIKENRKVHYSSNISIEKLVIEQLLEGPETEGLRSALPSGTKLVNISVVEGVCYVSLDETFRNQDYSVNEAIVIYSIVDSLSEIATISKVQISINGDTSGTYRDNFELSEMYARNLDYVTTLSTKETETENESEQVEETDATEETEDTKTETNEK